MENMYSTNQVAVMLKIRPHRLVYAISCGEIEDSSGRFLNKRVFTQEDVERIKVYFEELKGTMKGDEDEKV